MRVYTSWISPVPFRISVKRLARRTPPQEFSNSSVNSGDEAAGKRYNNDEISFNMCSFGGVFPSIR